ncbi:MULTISPECIES: glycine-rich protein [unclassified Brevibacillus]|uniref:glycine rich domain-containing protein n=1 Tax=unclassified Brevibacillus TaxID=2684853 RepID=UPI003563D35C
MAPIVGTDAQGRKTYTFTFSGSLETWQVPPNVTKIKLEAWGASGGLGMSDGRVPGGKGGYAAGDINVTAGEVLTIVVGGKGNLAAMTSGGITPGGYNGGGDGGTGGTLYEGGGSGGGATDVRKGGTTLNNRILVAAGGGGGGGTTGNAGGDGGGITGGDSANSSGSGATQTSGGNGEGGKGTLGVGGPGRRLSYLSAGGGGGGGGYYGGGGGGGVGGGGGSSYTGTLANSTTVAGQREGDGQVVITILNSPPTLTINNADITASPAIGRSIITLSGTVTDTNRDTITISATLDGKTKTDTVTGDISSQSWMLTWGVNSDNISQGVYRNIVVTANDGAGGVASISYTGTITVDKTAPVITISGIVNGAVYQNSVTPTFSATDAGGSGLMTVTATLNGAAYTSGTAITTSGAKTLIVTATDNAGNQSQQTINFTVNKTPTLSLTSSSDNQTLSEGSHYKIEGNATDSDSGNVVTAKYKLNNGPVRALQSGVSNGSTPISFVKTLTYRNKRLWDGSTDLVGVDLAENTDHTLTVWAEDDQGGRSGEATRKFRVVWNRPPVIDGENKDLGVFLQPPTVNYSATDPEGNTFTFSEYLDGKQIRSFAGVAGQQYTVEISHDSWIRLELDVQHQIKIVATDGVGMLSERIYTFIRKETHIEFMLEFGNPDIQADFTLDGMPLRVLVTLERYLPEGSSIESVKVCNNYLDAVPTWEDCTNAVKVNRGYLFTNKNKTAPDWAINLWVTIDKGTAKERILVNGYGGAFD